MNEKILASKHEPYINIEEIGSLLKRLIAGRTTPFVDPRRRSWRTKLSFELCRQIDLNDQMSHVLEHNTSCVDRIFFKLCNARISRLITFLAIDTNFFLLINVTRYHL